MVTKCENLMQIEHWKQILCVFKAPHLEIINAILQMLRPGQNCEFWYTHSIPC